MREERVNLQQSRQNHYYISYHAHEQLDKTVATIIFQYVLSNVVQFAGILIWEYVHSHFLGDPEYEAYRLITLWK